MKIRPVTLFTLFTTLLVLTLLAPAGAHPALAQTPAQNVELVGQIGGATYAVFVQGQYAYIGEGPNLTILNISNPTNPTVVGKIILPDIVMGVAVSGSYAYVADGYYGLQIINISNPADPTFSDSYDTPGYAHGVAVSGSYAYVADGDSGLRVINISNPANPTFSGSYDTPGCAYSVAVSGSYAYVADGDSGLQVINISNPANPTFSGSYITLGWAYGVAVSGSYAYVAEHYGLQVINISNPANPILSGSYDTPGDAWGVTVSGSYAYVADDSDLQVTNISNPANPTFSGSYDTPGCAYSVAVSGSYAYVADGDSGLQVINISNPANPTFSGGYITLGLVYGVAISGNYAYVADGDYGLQVININNPVNPILSGSYDTGHAEDVAVSGSYAYVADGYYGLQIINISNPANPTLSGSYDTPGSALDVAVSGSYAYVADRHYGLQVINISNPANPTLSGSYDTPGYAHGVAVNGSYAYVTDESGGLQIINISNPTNPTFSGSYDTPGSALDVAVSGSYAYVADIGGGLQVINISNPANPTLSGSYDTPGDAWGVAVSGSYAYVVDNGNGNGLQVINISNPANPTLSGSYDTPGYAHSVAVNGSYAYVADIGGGLDILRFTGGTLPLIFIPGVAGSYLVDRHNNQQLWLGLFTDHTPLSLYPGDHPSSDIIATDAIRRSGGDFYGPLLEELVANGYREYQVNNLPERRTTAGCDNAIQQGNQPKLFVFAYDWRKSLVQTAAALKDYVGCVQKFYPGQKINIVAHSMGGLVARRYILDNSADSHVNALITLGAPWLGAPKMVYALETGDFFGEDLGGNFRHTIVIWRSTVKYLLGSFSGAHHLLPGRAYYEVEGTPCLAEDGWDFDGDGQSQEVYNYANYLNVLNSQYGQVSFDPGMAADTFHAYITTQGGQDDWRNDATGIKYYHLAGVQGQAKTIGQVVTKARIICTSTPSMFARCNVLHYAEPRYTRGDGTVPLPSLSSPLYQVPGRYLWFPHSSASSDENVNHTDMVHNPEVMAKVLELLTQAAPGALSTSQIEAQQEPPPAVPAYYLTLLGQASVTVQDTLSNTALLATDTITGYVPSVDIHVPSDRAAMMIIPTYATYTVTFETTTTPLAVDVTLGTDVTTTQAIRYVDVTLPVSVTARLVFTPQGVVWLRYDSDKDGSFESVLTPTVAISGTLAQDVTPPVITVTVTAQPPTALVTLTAVDDLSGVKNLFYSLDGSYYQVYTGSLRLDPEQTPVFYAFADDNVANRSGLVTYQLRRQVYLPIILK